MHTIIHMKKLVVGMKEGGFMRYSLRMWRIVLTWRRQDIQRLALNENGQATLYWELRLDTLHEAEQYRDY